MQCCLKSWTGFYVKIILLILENAPWKQKWVEWHILYNRTYLTSFYIRGFNNNIIERAVWANQIRYPGCQRLLSLYQYSLMYEKPTKKSFYKTSLVGNEITSGTQGTNQVATCWIFFWQSRLSAQNCFLICILLASLFPGSNIFQMVFIPCTPSVLGYKCDRVSMSAVSLFALRVCNKDVCYYL